MEKKVGIFDLDGTLVDAYQSITENFNHALKILGYPSVSAEQVKSSVGGGNVSLASKFVKRAHVAELLSLYGRNYRKFLKGRVKLMQGSLQLLKYLKETGMLLGLATNRARFSVPVLLEELKIEKYFDIIFTADDVAKPKPDPEMIFRIMKAFKAGPSEIFYVGDMDIDFFTGKNAGVDTYILSTGSTPRPDLEKIDNINLFENLCSLEEYLKETT